MAFELQPLMKSPVSNLWRFWHSNCGFSSKIWKEIEWPNQILPGWTQFCVIFNCWSCGKKSWSTIENYTKLGPSWQNLVWPFNFFSYFALETTIRMSKSSEVWLAISVAAATQKPFISTVCLWWATWTLLTLAFCQHQQGRNYM